MFMHHYNLSLRSTWNDSAEALAHARSERARATWEQPLVLAPRVVGDAHGARNAVPIRIGAAASGSQADRAHVEADCSTAFALLSNGGFDRLVVPDLLSKLADRAGGVLREAIDALVVENFDRAAPRGVGNIKAAGNYAPGERPPRALSLLSLRVHASFFSLTMIRDRLSARARAPLRAAERARVRRPWAACPACPGRRRGAGGT